MTTGKIKLVVILAALILAGGLLTIVGRVAATPSQQQQDDFSIPPAPEQVMASDSNEQSEAGASSRQFGVPGGREFFYKMLLSISVVIVLSVAVIYISRKLLPRLANLPGKQIRVIETTYIAPRKGIHLIQIGARRLLVASTAETITMLADVTDSSATSIAAQSSFAKTLEDKLEARS
jgi:flagellar biogenesis protein FliO